MNPIEAEARDFAAGLTATVLAAVGPQCPPFRARALPNGHLTVRQEPKTGIPLRVANGSWVTLVVRYRCSTNSRGEHLRVDKSTFVVYYGTEAAGEPLFHYDYDRDAPEGLPRAHLQVHEGQNLAALLTLSDTGTSRGSRRLKKIDDGQLPSQHDLHFPLGGDRFRPSLEDVLQMLITELGVHAQRDWIAALGDGRQTWRDRQLEAAVGDNPTTAALKLQALGYRVTPPEGGHPHGSRHQRRRL